MKHTDDKPKEALGGEDGSARCACGRLRYPRYAVCPKCYYEQKDAPKKPTPPDKSLRTRTVDELLEMRPRKPMPLSDRHERIRFLEQRYGKTFRGQEIRYMRNSQLYAISEQAGYRRR